MNLQLHQQEQIDTVRAAILDIPEVLECYSLTGEYDYLLKVAIRNRKDLERFVMHHLTKISGVHQVHTSIVLTELKSTTALPIE
jgi:DNA-binding Lrp family transcriptional regulator